jgi:ferredoxin
MPVTVINSRCPQNHPCPAVRRCAVGALTQNGFNAPVVDNSKCIDCGKCTSFCPMGALKLSKEEKGPAESRKKLFGIF